MTRRTVLTLRLVASWQLREALLLATCLLVGCGGGEGGATVTGVVTFNGAPVTTGVIGFYKAGTKALGAPISPDGSYSLTIPPGDYQVRVDAPSPMPEGWKEGQPLPKLPPRPVPEKYATFDSSGITAAIDGEANQQFDVKLP
ncbi:MAG: hypothetical protein JNL18_02000 [Planctomycetaceae bacterium]|nr:hypothetical protein [Planctomycetaceae bacterium]